MDLFGMPGLSRNHMQGHHKSSTWIQISMEEGEVLSTWQPTSFSYIKHLRFL